MIFGTPIGSARMAGAAIAVPPDPPAAMTPAIPVCRRIQASNACASFGLNVTRLRGSRPKQGRTHLDEFWTALMTWEVSGEAEFQAIMETIDADMRRSQVPIHLRELGAIQALGKRLGVDHGILLSDLPAMPGEGSYQGHDLTKRVCDWINNRYGDRLKINFSPGTTVVPIRGDLYRVVLPLMMGKIILVCDPTKLNVKQPNNAFNYVEDLEPALALSLSTEECEAILNHIGDTLMQLAHIKGRFPPTLKQGAKALIQEARNDLAGCADDMLRFPAAFGKSRYHSSQASEKFIKALLDQNGIKYGKVHRLNDLAQLAQSLISLSPASLAAANCVAGVRYGEVPSTLTEAFEAHRASLSICAEIGKTIGLAAIPLQIR
jgi:hypothetical protein